LAAYLDERPAPFSLLLPALIRQAPRDTGCGGHPALPLAQPGRPSRDIDSLAISRPIRDARPI